MTKRTKKTKKLSTKSYEKALAGLQSELVKLQCWVQAKGDRAVVVFESRAAPGAGRLLRKGFLQKRELTVA